MATNAGLIDLDQLLPLLVEAQRRSGGSEGTPAGAGGLFSPYSAPIGGIKAVQAQKTRKGQIAAGTASVLGNLLRLNYQNNNPLGLPEFLGGPSQSTNQGQQIASSIPVQQTLMDSRVPTASRNTGVGQTLTQPTGGPAAAGGLRAALDSVFSGAAGGAASGAAGAGAGAAGAAGAGAGAAGAAGAGAAGAAGAGAAGGAAAGAGAAGAGAAGAAGGAAAGGASAWSGIIAALAALFCWVAEELFGPDDRRTTFARLWCAANPDHPFVRLYSRHGRAWAVWLRAHPWAKPLVAPVWELMARRGEAMFWSEANRLNRVV